MQRLMRPITIQLKPSPLLLGLLGVVSIACCTILAQLQIAFAIKFALIALVIVSAIYFILRDVLLNLPQSWQSLAVNGKGELVLTNRQGQQHMPALASSSFIHSLVIVLNIKKSFFSVGLPPIILITDQGNTESLRRLRVWLRWWQHHVTDSVETLEKAA